MILANIYHNHSLGDDLESYLVNNGPMILDDICGVTVGLCCGDGAPALDYVNVMEDYSRSVPADNIQGESTVCHYQACLGDGMKGSARLAHLGTSGLQVRR